MHIFTVSFASLNSNHHIINNYPIKIFQDQLKVGELNYFSIGSVDDYHVAPLDVLSLKDMAGNGYVFDDKLSELLTISNEEDNSILLFVRIKK